MRDPITLPLWLFILILLFAAVTFASNFLFPSVRWFFRRRAERVVAELNKRLERPIQPFKLLRRQDMIQRVLYDPEVVRAVAAHADKAKVREDVAFEKARDYAREIVPSFSASAYFGVAIRATRWLSNLLFDVRVHSVDPEALASIPPDATIVYVMNHRSNLDYVLVTYLAAQQSALSYAVGEWARVWPLSRLIRAMGAYFIRRKARTDLYRRVLASYVAKATEAGVTQAVFPEGGLSRNGGVGAPKLGILSWIVGSAEATSRDVVFVPVALNYDRVVEDRILVAADREEGRRFRASAPEAIQFSLRYLRRRMTGSATRFGIAAVVFGKPVFLNQIEGAEAGARTAALGDAVMHAVSSVVPVTPVPMILTALTGLARPATAEVVAAEVTRLLGTLAEDVIVTTREMDVTRHLDVLVRRQILSVSEAGYQIEDADVVAFYTNSIAHHLTSTKS